MAGNDLFGVLDSLWTKEQFEGSIPSFFIMHRFLASDKDLAPVCQVLAKDLREPQMILRTWQGLLPKGRGAPRLSYAAPKKAPAEDELTARIMESFPCRRERAEEIVEFFQATGRELDLYEEYGIKPPKELED